MSWLRNKWLTRACGLLLGGFFLYAVCPSMWREGADVACKIMDPPDFAKSVNNYKLLPSEAVNAVAIFLPWLELFCGLALVTGFARTGAALLSGLLLVVFIGALSYNLYIGHPVICGCTMTYEEALATTDEQKFREMKLVILRDVGLLVLALQNFFAGCCVPAKAAASGASEAESVQAA